MTEEQLQMLQDGELQLRFEKADANKVKRIIDKVFPNDPTSSIVGGKTTFLTAWKNGMWKCSDRTFKLQVVII